MVPQNPAGQPNPDVQLQNLQNSQQALQSLQNMMATVSALMAKVADVDDALGTDTGLRQAIEQKTSQAIMQTDAYQLMAKMGVIADVSILKDPNKMSQMQVQIQRNITDYTSRLNQSQNATQNATQEMSY